LPHLAEISLSLREGGRREGKEEGKREEGKGEGGRKGRSVLY
jgi:hypothetical protein